MVVVNFFRRRAAFFHPDVRSARLVRTIVSSTTAEPAKKVRFAHLSHLTDDTSDLNGSHLLYSIAHSNLRVYRYIIAISAEHRT